MQISPNQIIEMRYSIIELGKQLAQVWSADNVPPDALTTATKAASAMLEAAEALDELQGQLL